MCSYITDILVQYWMKEKITARASLDQECILQLDIWIIHHLIAFRTWLDRTWPWIKYRFVPTGTTGIAQPCSIGIQCPLNLSIKESKHGDIIKEMMYQLQ
ncbi:hypothetical protein PAXRUDRAFT_104284, partial [Paxillus rubicundulus Ve08.2h10]